MHRAVALLALAFSLSAPAAARADGGIYTLAGGGSDSDIRNGEPATRAGLFTDVAIAPLPGGGFLFAEGAQVWRVDPQGLVHLVAGNGRYANSGDGGPAVEAAVEVSDLAATPDGGFLIVDQVHGRVRKVDARGTITTVAGGGRLTGEDVPATRAHLVEPANIAALPDGGFAVLTDDYLRVRRVFPDGRIRTIAGNGKSPNHPAPARGEQATSIGVDSWDIAAASDGSVLIDQLEDSRILRVAPDGALTLVADFPSGSGLIEVAGAPDGSVVVATRGESPPRLWRIAPDGSRQVIAGAGPFVSTAPDRLLPRVGGESALRAPLGDVSDLAVLPDGGVLLSTGYASFDELGGFVHYVAPAAPQVLAAALLRTRDRLIGRRTFASVSLTLPATVTLSVGGRSATARLPAGMSRVELPPVRPDGPHRVRLVAAAADGQRAHDSLRVYPRRWLPRETTDMLADTLARRVVDLGEFGATVDRCRRFAATRIDCRLHGGKKRDCASLAISFTGARVRWGAYGCRLAAHPRYARRPHPLTRRDARCHRHAVGCLAGRVGEADLLPSG